MVNQVMAATQCSATAKATQARCRRWAIRGGTVCIMHGANAAVRARAAARVLEAESRARNEEVPDRDPGEALASAARDADRILQQLKRDLDGGAFTPASLLALGDWIDRAARINKVVLDAGIDERRTRLQEAQVETVVAVLRAVVGAFLERLAGELDPAVFGRVRAAWPDWTATIVPAQLRALAGGAT